jgi:hypothetical protein
MAAEAVDEATDTMSAIRDLPAAAGSYEIHRLVPVATGGRGGRGFITFN